MDGVTEDVFGPPTVPASNGIDKEIQIAEFAAGNPNIKVTMSSSKRLALTNEPVRFYSEISLLVGAEDAAVPLFDTTAIHARRAALIALGD